MFTHSHTSGLLPEVTEGFKKSEFMDNTAFQNAIFHCKILKLNKVCMGLNILWKDLRKKKAE